MDVPAVRLQSVRKVWTAASGLMAATGGALMIAGMVAVAPFSMLFLTCAAVAAVGTGLLMLLSRRTTREEGTLRAAPGALTWNGAPLLASGELREAIAYANGDKHGVRLSTRRAMHYFELASREEADAIVGALGMDSRGGAMNVAGNAIALVAFTNLGAQLARHVHSRLGLATFLVGAIALPALVWLLSRQRWLVGSDGLLIKQGIARGRFIPYRSIERVTVDGMKLRIALDGDKIFVLRGVDDSRERSWPVVGVGALARRIEQAREAASRSTEADIASTLARRGRALSAWVRELSTLLGGGAGYRSSAWSRDQLWRTLEDTAQPADVRAAAAVALRQELAEGEHQRLRVAAESCASPKLRVAFEAAIHRDDVSAEEALAEVDAEVQGEPPPGESERAGR